MVGILANRLYRELTRNVGGLWRGREERAGTFDFAVKQIKRSLVSVAELQVY